MSEANGTTPEGLPKSNDPRLEELAERVNLGRGTCRRRPEAY